MEREGRAVKVFAKDKPQTSKVDVPSEWTPSGIHSTPCDRGLFVTARKKPDTLCLQLEAPCTGRFETCQRPLQLCTTFKRLS